MRTVTTGDAKDFINERKEFDSVVTSLPDVEETTMTPEEWENFFKRCVAAIVHKTKNYAIFYQTDRRIDGGIISKAHLTLQGIHTAKAKVVWHKIALRKQPDQTDLFRPTFTHIICASRNKKSGTATPDVLFRGEMTYKNAMGSNAAKMIMSFIKKNSDTKTITDPFCGQGSVLAAANEAGFDAEGNDIDPEMVKASQELFIKPQVGAE